MHKRKWWNWLLGMSDSEIQEREEHRRELDKHYEDLMNRERQMQEDDAWDRDIRYRADKMMMEWDKEMMAAKMKGLLDTFPNWTPLIIAPLSRKLTYTVYHKETARYGGDTNKIHEKLMERFSEVRAMNEPIDWTGIK